MLQSQASAPRAIVWAGLIAIFFGAVAPTLAVLEFSGGMENLNIATALELRRDHPGNWLIPTLEGEPRVKKPPLTAWITAAAIRPKTVAQMYSRDPAKRDAADRQLAWEVRWPSLLAACLMLIATYELGRVIADPTTGVVAALICGTTLMFQKFSRSAMIDVHLGLWVMIANVFLAHAVLRQRRWIGCLGAGVALGIAFMIKGPVPWVQSPLPVALFAAVRWWRESASEREADRVSVLRWIAPILLGIVVMLAIGLPWFLYVRHQMPHESEAWAAEITAERGERPSSVHEYLELLPYLLPWTIAFIGGLISARRAMVLAVFLCVVPLLAMSFYKDRKERYMYPMTGAAAVVAAGGMMTLARKRGPWNILDRAAVVQHWALLVLMGVVFPAVAATTWVPQLRTMSGEPWLPRDWGIGLTIALAVVIAAGMLVRRRWLESMLVTTVIVMLVVQAALFAGYAKTEAGLSAMRPLADAIWRTYPEARMFNAHPRGKRASVDLSIYLNRITDWVSMEELARVRPASLPQVVVMLQDPGTPPPAPPAGWKFVAKTRRDKDWWYAFVLEPTSER